MRKLTALFSVIVLMVGILALPITSYAYWNHGKVRIVSRGEDLKVRIVERGEDFTIRWVDRNPGVGEWEEKFLDLKILPFVLLRVAKM